MQSGMLTSREAAELLRLKPETIQAYVRTGKLRAVKVGRAYLLRQEAIERFLESPPSPEQAPAG
jgi:excisionase family DNA binding protein